MRWAVALPQVVDDTFDAAAFRMFLARTEALGFESAWTIEQPIGTAGLLSPLETMTYAAACTERVRLGCAVFVTPLHQPLHLAKAITTVDHLSGGRLTTAVGPGGRTGPFGAYGIDADGLVARFNETLDVMTALWTDPVVTFEGRFWQLDHVAMEPKPAQKPHPPLWFGGSAPAAIRRAVRRADGFFGAGSTTTAAFAEQVDGARRALDEQQRDPQTFPIAKRVYLAVDDDAERAHERVAAGLRRIYGPELGPRLDPVGVSGTPDDCILGLQAVADAGAELIMLNSLDDHLTQMEWLAQAVMPNVS